MGPKDQLFKLYRRLRPICDKIPGSVVTCSKRTWQRMERKKTLHPSFTSPHHPDMLLKYCNTLHCLWKVIWQYMLEPFKGVTSFSISNDTSQKKKKNQPVKITLKKRNWRKKKRKEERGGRKARAKKIWCNTWKDFGLAGFCLFCWVL